MNTSNLENWSPKFRLWDKVKFIDWCALRSFFWDTEITVTSVDAYNTYDDEWNRVPWHMDITYDISYKVWDKDETEFWIPEKYLILS